MNTLAFQILTFIALNQYVRSSCTEYHYSSIEGIVQTKSIHLDLENQQTLGMGFWMTYRPLGDENLAQNPDVVSSVNLKKLFVFALQEIGTEILSLFMYIDLQFEEQKITHIMILQTDSGIQYLYQPMVYDSYEGSWFFVYFIIDQSESSISFNHYIMNSKLTTRKFFEGLPLLFSEMQSLTGGYKNLKVDDSQILYLMTFPGLIQPVIIDFEDYLFNDIQQLLDYCLPYDQCYQNSNKKLASYNTHLTWSVLSFDIPTETRNYKLKGWVKQDQLTDSFYSETLLLRLSSNINYLSDNSQVGDKVLYVTYYQNTINLQLNGFSLQTYSYTEPWKPIKYNSDEKDTILVQGEEYKDLLTQWHYIQFQSGTANTDFQPIYTVYYAAIEKIEHYKWTKQINHFTASNFYLRIGGDDYSRDLFQGYLSDWILTLFCDIQDEIFIPKCHYSCLTCKGISSQDCTSCDESTFRIYSQSQHTCKCKYGYVDISEKTQCFELYQCNGAFEIQEKQITFEKKGYYYQDEYLVQCDFGYFKYKNACIQCPYAVQDNLIPCSDCILYPEEFSKKLKCTFQFNSTDEFSVLAYTLLDSQELEFYSIQQSFQEYKLQIRKGYEDEYNCKDGFFFSENHQCQECLLNCLECDDAQTCKKCKQRYIFQEDNCVQCLNCPYDIIQKTQAGVTRNIFCPQRMYRINKICYQCGHHCMECEKDQCYRCENNSEYYITLDSKNCAKCSIQNCQYCFQYYIKSDQTLVTSLDPNQKSEIVYSEIITACALCELDYFYSFVTNKCELKPIDMIECQSGVFIDSLGSTKCLVSNKLEDAIQQSICADKLCLSCINNYSQRFQSFCIICKDGYYSLFLKGQCKPCPQNCLTCAEFNKIYDDQWKWNIRAFYKYFINRNNNHPFETYQETSLKVICFSCHSNYQLVDQVCIQGCSEDCLNCEKYKDEKYQVKFKCTQCKKETFNLQRSVTPDNLNKCMTCPDFCSACYPRSPNQITAINPFFDQTSVYQKYTHICYQSDSINQEGTINILPKYIAPFLCKENNKCEQTFQVQYFIYCANSDQYECDYNAESNEFLKSKYRIFSDIYIFYKNRLEEKISQEILEYLNQIRITEVTFDQEFFYFNATRNGCHINDKFNLTNHMKAKVFTLQKSNLIFRNSQKSDTIKLPLITYVEFSLINFDKVTFQNIQFIIYQQDLYFSKASTPYIKFLNDYDPITLIFENCEIVQLYWDQPTNMTFYSIMIQKLLMQSINLEALFIFNSLIFNYQPPLFTNSFQQIDNFLINNSNFTNTSIFIYNANNYSLNQTVNFTNVTIMNTNFSSSFFINSSSLFEHTIGEINLENFYLQNLILQDRSVFFQISSASKLNAKNLTIINVIFLDQSSFLVCNVININGLMISNSIINLGSFIHIPQQINNIEITTKEICFTDISFINNTYSSQSSKSFIHILQDQSVLYDLICTNLFFNNNVLADSNLGRQSFIYISYKYSLIYIECNKCSFINLTIHRGIGLPEISIINSRYLKIHNLYIETREQYYKRSLHSSVECSKRFIYQDIPFVLYIWAYQNVQMDKAIIQNTIIADYQLIILLGKSRTESVQEEAISVSNLVIKNNLLLINNENRQSSIISIETQQISFITIKNIEFNNNFLNQYYQNSLQHSSATLLINAEQALINLQYLQFNNNYITNSSDSILYIQAKSLKIINCSFINQNILTDDVLKKNIISSTNQILKNIDVANSFQILSQGGNGFIQTNYLSILNTVINNSQAINGGGFYITTINDGIVSVANCSFENTSTVLNGNQLASGGLFFIDSSKSNLNLTLYNCSIKNAYSRTYGGAIYIEPSRTSNFISLNLLIINSVFSIQHSFLSISPKKEITISSQIKISNSTFQNSESDFEIFFALLQDLQEQNIVQFQTDNPLIYVQFSNFTMIDCHFNNIHFAYLVDIEQAIGISLRQLMIKKNNIFQSPILKLSLRTGIYFYLFQDTKGIIELRSIIVSQVIQFTLQQLKSCRPQTVIYQNLLCPQIHKDINQYPNIIKNQYNQDNQFSCNFNLLNQFFAIQNFSIIQISNIKTSHLIYIDNLMISQTQCPNCQFGVLNFQQFEKQLNLQTNNLKIIDNDCGLFGCLSIIKSVENISLSEDLVSSFQSKVNQIVFNTTLKNSIFINNTAHYGGACFLSQIDILINNTIFSNNQAKYFGGSIYYNSDQTILLILNSQIEQNRAYVGGGIYLQKQQLQRIEKQNLVIKENKATSFANNLYEAPRFLHLSLDRTNTLKNIQYFSNSTMIIEQVEIINRSKTDVLLLPSGIGVSSYYRFDSYKNSYISFNQSFRLQAQNLFGEKMTRLEQTQCQISAQKIDNSYPSQKKNFTNINQSQSEFISKSNVDFNIETGDYNLDDLIIYFNPYQDQKFELQLAFACNSIQIPTYNNGSIYPSGIIKNYILLLKIRTFQCQLGEYYNYTTGGCVLCDVLQSQYSVTINSSQCSLKDDTKISDIQPAMIELRPFFWRAYYYSDIIEQCHNLLANCEGGWFAGNPSCATGHLGALCEQCDIYNVKGQGEYSQNQSYQCSSCEQSSNNILNIVFVIIWTLLSVFITVTSTIQMIDDFIFQLKLKPLGFYTIAKPGSTSALLKVFTNYLQIVSSIASFQLSIPIGITLAVRGVGNPIGSVAFSLDCYLKNVSSIPIIYLRIIWGLAIAGMYIFLFFLFHIIAIFLQKKQFNITFVTTTLIYIYIYLSPNLVSELSSLISYRNISGQKWIASNVAYLYNSQLHKNWLIYFVTPTFLIIGLIMPFFFWYIVYHHRLTLNSTKTRKNWGYLYNEYKLSVYYWETIKIIQKELIILILIYYEDYVAIKACLIFFLLHLYSTLTTKFKPYLTENLNRIDCLSTSICKISIVLAWSIYSAQIVDIIEVSWPLYIVLAIINFYFIIEMFTKLLLAYFDKLYEQIDQIKTLIFLNLPIYMKKNKVCIRLLKNTTERKQIIRQRFQQMRVYLITQAKLIINIKKQHNMGLQDQEAIFKNKISFKYRKQGTIQKTSANLKLQATEIF